MKILEEFNKKLLVEGNDDQHVIWALCNKFSIEHCFDVIDCKGIDKLIKQFEVRLKLNQACIGIIVDADISIEDRWNQIRSVINKFGYQISTSFPSNGLIIRSNNLPTIGVWIMPDNNLNGMLEDFIKLLVPEKDALLSEAEKAIQRIEDASIHRYGITARSKALIHTWLAWQDDPGTPLGLAITKQYLYTEIEQCNTFIMWLKALFTN